MASLRLAAQRMGDWRGLALPGRLPGRLELRLGASEPAAEGVSYGDGGKLPVYMLVGEEAATSAGRAALPCSMCARRDSKASLSHATRRAYETSRDKLSLTSRAETDKSKRA